MGVLGAYKGTYQVLPRDLEDLIASGSIHMTVIPRIHSLNTSGFSVDWTMDVARTTEAFYGFTPGMESGILSTSGNGIADITRALNQAHGRGVIVRVVHNGNTDYGIMHNKFVVFDVLSADPDKTLVWTGSHNWSQSSSVRNDENTLVIYDQGVANAYYQEFVNRFAAGELLVSNPEYTAGPSDGQGIHMYPNPADRCIYISGAEKSSYKNLTITDLNGRTLKTVDSTSDAPIKVSELRPGIYLLQIRQTDGTITTHKILIQ